MDSAAEPIYFASGLVLGALGFFCEGPMVNTLAEPAEPEGLEPRRARLL